MAILDFGKDRWMAALGWTDADVPDVLVLEGTWWHAQATKTRLAMLDEVVETGFPISIPDAMARHGSGIAAPTGPRGRPKWRMCSPRSARP